MRGSIAGQGRGCRGGENRFVLYCYASGSIKE